MIIAHIVVAFFIAWIWVDYYRMVDLYETEKLGYVIVAFLLGCASVLGVHLWHHFVGSHLFFTMNGGFLNDLLFCTVEIGMVEEFSKFAFFGIFWLLFRKQINEPVDYIVYVAIAALGFSATENIQYFQIYGSDIIGGRSILCSLGHMMFTSFIAYGIVVSKYKYAGKRKYLVLIGFVTASFGHGVYNFWLMWDGVNAIGQVLTWLFWLCLISLFATMLNNALNNSPFFTFKKVIDSSAVAKRLFIYYSIVLGLQLILVFIETDKVEYSIVSLVWEIPMIIIVIIAATRLSRFKLIKNRWFKLKFQLPVYRAIDANGNRQGFRFRGESFNEAKINAFYEEYFYLAPLSERSVLLNKRRLAYIDKKMYLKKDVLYYRLKVFLNDKEGPFDTMLISPRTFGRTEARDKYPVVGVYYPRYNKNDKTKGKYVFKEWSVLTPLDIKKAE